ncbi:MAG TPA: nucleotidyltransferase domain-containing protein [Syntrophales bacterium]|nr:nucleotidyltransferase domain-containing protein [Syntrophales bacterium]
MKLLPEILSSKIRSEIFRILFGVNDEALHLREIERRSGLTVGTVQQELKKLLSLDLIKRRKDGNRLYYQANKEHPLYPEIRNIVLKTSGLADFIKSALSATPDIKIAFVFGSVARDEDNARSDVDLMVIGSIGLRKLTGLLMKTSEQIGREINPYVLTESEFNKRRKDRDHFITQILEAPKIFVIGSRDDIKTMGRVRVAQKA